MLALRWLIDEMERRYKIFARVGVRNIVGFNARPKKERRRRGGCRCEDEKLQDAGREIAAPARQVPREDELQVPDKMPYVVVIIDELADLMQTAPADVETGSRASRKWLARPVFTLS